MSWEIFFIGVGLMLVLEGVLPFLSPDRWRRFVQAMSKQSDRGIRITGLVSMLIGLSIVIIIHQFIL